MRRRSDMGEWESGDFVCLLFILLALWGLCSDLATVATDLHRIADAACVYAPPAEPVKEAPADGKTP